MACGFKSHLSHQKSEIPQSLRLRDFSIPFVFLAHRFLCNFKNCEPIPYFLRLHQLFDIGKNIIKNTA